MPFDFNKIFFYDIRIRLTSSLFLIIIPFFAFYLGQLPATFLISVCSSIIIFEICNITSLSFFSDKIAFLYKILFSVTFFCTALLYYYEEKLYFFIIFLLLFLSIINKNGRIIRSLFLIYIIVSLLIFIELIKASFEKGDFIEIIFILSIVISTDVGGYLFGKIFRGKKIFPKISPNKTWSGCLGGILLSVTTSLLFFKILNYEFFLVIFISFFLSFFAQLGDIIESLFKRYYKVKDSGKLIPGHGGFFDRFDSLLSAIVCYYLLHNIIL